VDEPLLKLHVHPSMKVVWAVPLPRWAGPCHRPARRCHSAHITRAMPATQPTSVAWAATDSSSEPRHGSPTVGRGGSDIINLSPPSRCAYVHVEAHKNYPFIKFPSGWSFQLYTSLPVARRQAPTTGSCGASTSSALTTWVVAACIVSSAAAR
jgi:hypothetical protein